MPNHFQIFSSLPQTLKSWKTLGTTKCKNFQQKHPIFFCALYWLAGSIARSHPDCGVVILLFLCPFLSRDPKLWISQGLCWLIPLLTSPPPSYHEGPALGTFTIHYAKGDTYYGEASSLFTSCGGVVYNLPCKIVSEPRLELRNTYLLQGTLHHTPQIIFKSNARGKEPLKPQPLTPKQKLRKHCDLYLHTLFPKGNSGAFASSLLLGSPLPKELSLLFRGKGLSHLFVISGWHFALLFSILEFLFSIFALKTKRLLSFIILSLATLILPSSPSVWRAWVSISLLCFSPYFSGSCSGFNRLGLGFLFCAQFFSPLSPAFALSFLATLGIQLFFSPIYLFFYTPWTILLPAFWLRPIRYFCNVLALSLSTQIFLFLPLTTFFGSFVLDGLIYNLFFPLILIPMIFLILSSVLCPPLSSLAETAISWLLSHPWLHTPEILASLSLSPPSPKLFTISSLVLFILGVSLTKASSQKPSDSFSNFIQSF